MREKCQEDAKSSLLSKSSSLYFLLLFLKSKLSVHLGTSVLIKMHKIRTRTISDKLLTVYWCHPYRLNQNFEGDIYVYVCVRVRMYRNIKNGGQRERERELTHSHTINLKMISYVCNWKHFLWYKYLPRLFGPEFFESQCTTQQHHPVKVLYMHLS